MKPTSPSYYTHKKIESDQKDIIIAQLKAENFELKQKDKDYSLIHSQVLDLEHKIKLISEEKTMSELQQKEKEELYNQNIFNLNEDINFLRRGLEEKNAMQKELSSQLYSSRQLLENKNLEINKLKSESFNYLEHKTKLLNEKRVLEVELVSSEDEKKKAQIELEKQFVLNNSISESKKLDEAKIRNKELELYEIEQKYVHANKEVVLLSSDKKKLEVDLDFQKEARYLQQKETENMIVLNAKLASEKKALEEKAREVELNLSRTEKKIVEISSLIDLKEKELNQARLSLSFNEEKNMEASATLLKLKKEKEAMSHISENYKREAELNKRLRDEQSLRAMELEIEKARLEKEALNKEVEAISAKKDLTKANELMNELHEGKYYIEKELDAMKEHTNILERQNWNLHDEISNIVTTDEAIRRDLDRRFRVENMKAKNLEELQRSSEKVRLSSSPKRFSPYRSPYK